MSQRVWNQLEKLVDTLVFGSKGPDNDKKPLEGSVPVSPYPL